jgi:glycosyltransferase involved in cell wall biosynthesis
MKSICFFNSTRFWGGGEKLHLEYAEKFMLKGYQVILAAKAGSTLETRGKALGIPVHQVKVSNLSAFNPFKIAGLKRFFKSSAIDTVFFSTSQDAKAGGLAAKRAGVSNIVYLRGLAVPIKKNPLNAFLLRKVYTHLLVNSHETARTMKKNFGSSFPDEKIKVIYHGIDLEEFDKMGRKPVLDRRPGQFIIGNAGRLTKQKGQHLLIEIAKELRNLNLDFKICIAGTGDLEDELKEEIKKQQLENYIELLGFVSDVNSFMNDIDVFALTSLWEGFGYVIVEAMAAYKPVVAFDRSSNPEIITDKETGFLVPDVDTTLFAQRIRQLIEDHELLRNMGLKAHRSVEQRFGLQARIDEIEEYLIKKT